MLPIIDKNNVKTTIFISKNFIKLTYIKIKKVPIKYLCKTLKSQMQVLHFLFDI